MRCFVSSPLTSIELLEPALGRTDQSIAVARVAAAFGATPAVGSSDLKVRNPPMTSGEDADDYVRFREMNRFA
jgi:hypothetical protein